MRARSVAGVAVAGALAAQTLVLYGLFIERLRIQLAEYSLVIDKPGLPPEGLTLLHLSDLHLRAGGRIQARKLVRLRRLLAGLDYDLALVTGDLIHNAAGFPVALALLRELKPRLGAFLVWGNHDYCEYTLMGVETGLAAPGSVPGRLRVLAKSLWQLAPQVLRNESLRFPVAHHDLVGMRRELSRAGVRLLLNTAVHLAAGPIDLWLAGVDDLVEGAQDLDAALAGVPDGALLLLLAHNPDAWLDPRAGRADLVLCGHTHGGQMRLPFLGAVHTQGTHLARRASAGWFRRGSSHMFVTRGVGESLPLRLGARPELALIRVFAR